MRSTATLLLLSCFFAARAQWTPMAFGQVPTGHIVTVLDAFDANVVWAATGSSDAWSGGTVPVDHQPVILRTTDGGQSWSTFSPPEALGRIPVTVLALGADEVYFTASTSVNDMLTSILVYTLDGGDSWETRVQGEMAQSIGLFLHRFNSQDWFAYSYGQGATSADGGTGWVGVSTPPIGSNEVVFGFSAVNMWAVQGDRIWIPTSRGRLFMSTDKGLNWSTVNTDLYPARGIHTIAFEDEMKGMAVSCFSNSFAPQPTVISVSSDGGQSWSNAAGAPTGAVSCLVAVPGVAGAFMATADASMGSGASYLTVDNGASWQMVDQGAPYLSLEFTAPDLGWVGLGAPAVDDGTPGIYKWTGGHVGLRELAADALGVFPNPVHNGAVTLKAPGMVGKVRVRILDVQGRLMRELPVTTPLQDGVVLDLGDLGAGLYTVEVLGDGARRVARVQVL